MTNSTTCKLCFKEYPTQKHLLNHERNRHKNNKIIPHFNSLPQPSLVFVSYYIESFIVLIKKRLGFSRHSIGKRNVTVDTFPENIFVYLFKNEETFKYSPTQRKYQCEFEGASGEVKLKNILGYDFWNVRNNPHTNTKGYILLEDYNNKYKIKFTWSQTVLKENNREFILSKMSCNFTTESGEFIDRYILT
jgi:hypothetical protein